MNAALAQLMHTHPSGLIARMKQIRADKAYDKPRKGLPPHHYRIIELREKLPQGFDKRLAMAATGLGERQTLEIMHHLVKSQLAVRMTDGSLKWMDA